MEILTSLIYMVINNKAKNKNKDMYLAHQSNPKILTVSIFYTITWDFFNVRKGKGSKGSDTALPK